MKCVFVVNVDVDPAKLSAAAKLKVKFRINTVKGKLSSIPYFPAGTEYEHPNAAFFCQAGSAAPADDECLQACGMTEDELAAVQRLYKITAAGIEGKDDIELWDAGVIIGYRQDGSYEPGPNWEEFMKARAQMQAAKAESDI